MKKKYISSLEFDYTKLPRVECSQDFPAVTEPNQAWSLEQILDRHRKGQLTSLGPIDFSGSQFHVGEDELNPEVVSRMDACDQMDFAKRVKEGHGEYLNKKAISDKEEADRLAKAKSERLAAKRSKLKDEILAELGLKKGENPPSA